MTASSAAEAIEHRSKSRSSAQNTNGTVAIDHDMFGKLVDETIGPHNPNAMAPSAAAGGVSCFRRNRNIPTAASGTGRATHRLYASTSGSRTRMSSDGR